MDPAHRSRAAAGLTLILISGLGLLIWIQTRAAEGLPVSFGSFPVGQIIGEGPERLFELPPDVMATSEADFVLDDSASVLYLIYIPRLKRYAPVVSIQNQPTVVGGQEVWQLSLPPAYAVGWSDTSAPVGDEGNTVFVGHNNEFGEVFRGLDELAEGDELIVRTPEADLRYEVTETALFEEEYRPLEERLDNAHWLAPTDDVRLTLITCWPYVSNTHRVVVVARPAGG